MRFIKKIFVYPLSYAILYQFDSHAIGRCLGKSHAHAGRAHAGPRAEGEGACSVPPFLQGSPSPNAESMGFLPSFSSSTPASAVPRHIVRVWSQPGLWKHYIDVFSKETQELTNNYSRDTMFS